MLQIEYENVYTLYERFLLDEKSIDSRNEEEKDNRLKEIFINKLMRMKLKAKPVSTFMRELRRAYEEMKIPHLYLEFETNSELIPGSTSGLGYLIFDIGLSWDPIFDVPYIPGSSLKGVVRSTAYEFLRRIYRNKVEEEIEAKLENVFGKSGEDGMMSCLVFNDAYPMIDGEVPMREILVEDIINPHYNAEVSGIKTELDVQPTPILHLVIRKGVKFSTIISASNFLSGGSSPLREEEENEIRKIAKELGIDKEGPIESVIIRLLAFLLGGASSLGIGGRTLKGYGRFSIQKLEAKSYGRREEVK
ncbi:MAG TPA: type III-B CRISPR module RAMP protein Cmr6 [Euryarchaeota archaeon]|nr:type III-B CRISPR module RAMP protein Cmr6 [Euryarchaeota archaeon]